MTRRMVALLVTVAAGLSLVVAGVIDPPGLFPWGIPTVVALLVGGVLTWRVPRNLVGWLIFVFATSSGLVVLLLAMAARLEPGLAGWLDAIGNAISSAGTMALPLALLRFPEGSLLTSRWRVVEWAALTGAVLGAAASMLNGGWGGDMEQSIGVAPFREATAPVGDVLSSIFYLLMLATMVLAATSLILRFGRSKGEDRLKIKWLAYSGAFLLLSFLTVFITGDWQVSLVSGWQTLLVASAFGSVPVAIGIAVLQYRLYDIDLVISRTLVLAALAGFITVVYTLVVVGLGRLLGSGADGLGLPIVATAIVAVAFEPIRSAAQRWANRLVYGRRATPYEVIADLTQRLARSETADGLLDRMAARLGDGTGAERATIWLETSGERLVGASWPAGTTPTAPDRAAELFPVTHDGEIVGALEVIKPRGASLSSSERRLIDDLAGSAGAVLGYQRLNDQLRDKASELAQSRVRLVEAQDTERRRLERDLHDGAQQLIVALKVKIGLARALAEKHGSAQLEGLLAGLADETQTALEDVRNLAKGIYPPVLESDGLGPAVSALAAGAPVSVLVESDGVDRYPRDVEAAVYFNISEAVTNAIKHAVAPIRVELSEETGVLRFSVGDSGPGFDPSSAQGGSGLQNLRDRIDAVGGTIEIESKPGGSTTVVGMVPLNSSGPQERRSLEWAASS